MTAEKYTTKRRKNEYTATPVRMVPETAKNIAVLRKFYEAMSDPGTVLSDSDVIRKALHDATVRAMATLEITGRPGFDRQLAVVSKCIQLMARNRWSIVTLHEKMDIPDLPSNLLKDWVSCAYQFQETTLVLVEQKIDEMSK